MSIVWAACPRCAKEIEIDDSNEYSFCIHCNNNFPTEDGISHKKMQDVSECEKIVKLADAKYNLKEYNHAYNYYEKVLQAAPDNANAIFKKGLCLAQQFREDVFRLEKAVDLAFEALDLAKNNLILKQYEYSKALFEIIKEERKWAYKYYIEDLDLERSVFGYWNCLRICIHSLEKVDSLLDEKVLLTYENATKLKADCKKELMELFCDICKNRSYISSIDKRGYPKKAMRYISDEERGQMVDKYNKTFKEIHYYDDCYMAPTIKKKGGNCYIATAVYGSYDAPEVLILRHWRDQILLKSLHGKIFVLIYYKLSPPIAKRLERASLLNSVARRILDKFVSILNKRTL